MLIKQNTTIRPDTYSEPAKDIAIKEVLKPESGEFIDTRKLIGNLRHDFIVQHRVDVRERWKATNPIYRCALCNVPVALLTNPQKRWFFRHSTEHSNCPAKTKSTLNQDEILARKFNGVKESEPHKRIKSLLIKGLSADTAFSNVAEEKSVMSSSGLLTHRRPDVQARCSETNFAFEIQLSTTFLDVIIGRKTFYKSEGWQLLWILPAFSPDYRRMVEDDILFTNNSNIFIINEETTNISIETRSLHLLCWYRIPKRNGRNIVSEWNSKIVEFSHITFERETQRAFYFDFEAENDKLKLEIQLEAENHKQEEALRILEELRKKSEKKQILLDDFENFWLNKKINSSWTDENNIKWDYFCQQFLNFGIELPKLPSNHINLEKFFYSVYSAKHAKSVGWDFDNLLSVAHNIAQFHKSQLLAFGFTLKIYGNDDFLHSLDKNRKWFNKSITIKKEIMALNPNYMPDWSLQPVTEFLFPELYAKLEQFYNRNKYEIETESLFEE